MFWVFDSRVNFVFIERETFLPRNITLELGPILQPRIPNTSPDLLWLLFDGPADLEDVLLNSWLLVAEKEL